MGCLRNLQTFASLLIWTFPQIYLLRIHLFGYLRHPDTDASESPSSGWSVFNVWAKCRVSSSYSLQCGPCPLSYVLLYVCLTAVLGSDIKLINSHDGIRLPHSGSQITIFVLCKSIIFVASHPSLSWVYCSRLVSFHSLYHRATEINSKTVASDESTFSTNRCSEHA